MAVAQPARCILIPRTVARTGRPGKDARLVRLSGLTMGTSWSAAFYACGPVNERGIAIEIAAVLDRVVQQMSTWLPTSDISRYNSAPAGTWHDLADGFFTVLSTALDVARDTDGAYDPAAGALVQLWGFGSEGPRQGPPDDDAIAYARGVSGWQRLEIDNGRRRIRQPGYLQLDLSSIAKGYGVDEVSRCLERLGVRSYLCEIGGELRGAGMKRDGSPWWVDIEAPPGSLCPETLIALHQVAIATSGDYVRSSSYDGRRYGHTLDPRTGRPLAHDVSVSVVSDDCMTADAWATALCVLGPKQGLDFANRRGLAARLIGGGHGGVAFSAAALEMLN